MRLGPEHTAAERHEACRLTAVALEDGIDDVDAAALEVLAVGCYGDEVKAYRLAILLKDAVRQQAWVNRAKAKNTTKETEDAPR